MKKIILSLLGLLLLPTFVLANVIASASGGTGDQNVDTTQLTAQMFPAGETAILTSVTVPVKAFGSITGNYHFSIYATTGTYGSTMKPTGSPLAVSDEINVSTLTGSYVETTLNFSGANQITLVEGQYYALVAYYSGNSYPNGSVYWKSYTTYSGNSAYSPNLGSSWIPFAGNNNFIITGTPTTGGESGVSSTSPKILFVGDSMTESVTWLVTHPYDYNIVMPQWMGESYTKVNLGVSSQTIQTINATRDTVIDGILPNTTGNIVVIWAGSCDFANNSGTTPQQAFNYLKQLGQHEQSLGHKVIVLTMLPRVDNVYTTNVEALRTEYNTLIRDNWQSFADQLADVASDSRIGDAGDNLSSYYLPGDGVHLGDTGYVIVTGIVQQAINNLIAPTVASSGTTIPQGSYVFTPTQISTLSSFITGIQTILTNIQNLIASALITN